MFQPPPSVYILLLSAYVPSLPHLVDPFKIWTYHLMVLFLQSVTNDQMEPDQIGDTSIRRGNPKESIPKSGLA
jgi:hypothetical protein